MTSTEPTPAVSSELLQLHAVFAALDCISPSLPPTQSITLPKLKEALSIHAHWSFPDTHNPPTTSTPTSPPHPQTHPSSRHLQRAEREGHLLDILHAVDLNRNGVVDFHELIKAVEVDREEKERRRQAGVVGTVRGDGEGEDEEWEPTREVGGSCAQRPCAAVHGVEVLMHTCSVV